MCSTSSWRSHILPYRVLDALPAESNHLRGNHTRPACAAASGGDIGASRRTIDSLSCRFQRRPWACSGNLAPSPLSCDLLSPHRLLIKPDLDACAIGVALHEVCGQASQQGTACVSAWDTWAKLVVAEALLPSRSGAGPLPLATSSFSEVVALERPGAEGEYSGLADDTPRRGALRCHHEGSNNPTNGGGGIAETPNNKLLR